MHASQTGLVSCI